MKIENDDMKVHRCYQFSNWKFKRNKEKTFYFALVASSLTLTSLKKQEDENNFEKFI